MSTTAKIAKIKNKTKSKVLISGIIRFQYLRRVATHAGLKLPSEATNHSRIAAFSALI